MVKNGNSLTKHDRSGLLYRLCGHPLSNHNNKDRLNKKGISL